MKIRNPRKKVGRGKSKISRSKKLIFEDLFLVLLTKNSLFYFSKKEKLAIFARFLILRASSNQSDLRAMGSDFYFLIIFPNE
jgi:hypothetical protein